MMQPMFLVVWVDSKLNDHYHAHESLSDAQAHYDELLDRHDPHTASIAVVIKSTDYPEVPVVVVPG